jgi:2,3-diketo-5-methylthio-1-phosphopentane phosphatase
MVARSLGSLPTQVPTPRRSKMTRAIDINGRFARPVTTESIIAIVAMLNHLLVSSTLLQVDYIHSNASTQSTHSACVQLRHQHRIYRDKVILHRTNAITGHLWTTGFKNGDLRTPLFDDVVPTLSAWKSAGKTLAIFSSGSVQAQLQFFSYVKDGPTTTRDIKPLFSAHYDTVNGGPKLEKTSYEKICSELGKDVSKVTFLTDNVKGTLTLAATSLLETTHIRLTALTYPTIPLSARCHSTAP